MNSDDFIKIRKLSSDDVSLVFSWRNDPRIRKYMFNTDPIDPDVHVAWFEKTHQDPKRHLLLACYNERPFGFVQFNVSGCGSVADWGFYVDPDGPKGQGRMLGRAALNYGFNTLSLHKICGQVLSENSRSLAFHEKIGFILEGILRSHRFHVNGYQDVHFFGILDDEWTSG
jgi:UDP-4-amino-4,6-dideoxy-N-acetyl-beta-L-altrosamine N-acetyltransferase